MILVNGFAKFSIYRSCTFIKFKSDIFLHQWPKKISLLLLNFYSFKRATISSFSSIWKLESLISFLDFPDIFNQARFQKEHWISIILDIGTVDWRVASFNKSQKIFLTNVSAKHIISFYNWKIRQRSSETVGSEYCIINIIIRWKVYCRQVTT